MLSKIKNQLVVLTETPETPGGHDGRLFASPFVVSSVDTVPAGDYCLWPKPLPLISGEEWLAMTHEQRRAAILLEAERVRDV